MEEIKTGEYRMSQRIKADATPIDDVVKFAWDDDDYEWFEEWFEFTDEQIAAHKAALESEEKKKQAERFVEETPKRIDGIESSQKNISNVQDDILLTLADVLGGI